jgi:hypothetical protein
MVASGLCTGLATLAIVATWRCPVPALAAIDVVDDIDDRERPNPRRPGSPMLGLWRPRHAAAPGRRQTAIP